MISYEVRVEFPDDRHPVSFAAWMLGEHIPRVLHTGCFSHAEFAQLSGRVFRTRYVTRDRAQLDNYLRAHAPRLRAEFAERFGEATVSREEWTILRQW
jgi:hypothetical protein